MITFLRTPNCKLPIRTRTAHKSFVVKYVVKSPIFNTQTQVGELY